MGSSVMHELIHDVVNSSIDIVTGLLNDHWSKMDIEQCCLWSSMKELCHGFDCIVVAAFDFIVVAAFDFIVVAAHHRVARGNFRRCYSGGLKLWQGPRLDIRNLFQGSRPS